MKVLVDTSVWSLAFRKGEKTEAEIGIVELLSELIRDTNIVIIGPVRQEILSGISSKDKYNELKQRLSIFKDNRIETEDYEYAAECYNICRSNGIQGSHIDYLICATAINNDWTILTLDKDFNNYKQFIPIRTMKIESV